MTKTPAGKPAKAAAKAAAKAPATTPATTPAKPPTAGADAPRTYTEKVTINGRNVVIAHHQPPVVNAGVLENGDIFRLINVFDDTFAPTNATRADGTPLRLFTSPRTKVDVSKRRKEDMSFWHRNIDAHEIIFCVKGALAWETELGNVTMKPGDMLFIPKGIAHRSLLAPDSSDENVLIELKIADELEYVGDDH